MGGMTQSHGAGRRLREDDAESAAPAASAVVAALPAKPFELDRPEVRAGCTSGPQFRLNAEDARRVVLLGLMPDWPWFLGNLFFSFIMFYFGILWFSKTRQVFAEIL